MMKKLLPVLLMLLVLLTGCQKDEAQGPVAKEFSAAGMNITLTDEFTEKSQMRITGYYLSDQAEVMALLEEYALFANTGFTSANTVEEYAQLVWSANGFQGEVELTAEDGLTYFMYESLVNGNTYAYRAYVFKDAQGFWLVQFSAFKDGFENMLPTFQQYAKTITFDQPYVG